MTNIIAPRAGSYRDYHLLETFTQRVRSGRAAQVSGVISNSGNRSPTYPLSVTTGSISWVGDRSVISLDQINLNSDWPPANPDQNRRLSTQISTGVAIQDGKTVVIGKAGLPGKNRGLFLIIKVRAVE